MQQIQKTRTRQAQRHLEEAVETAHRLGIPAERSSVVRLATALLLDAIEAELEENS